MYKDVLRSIEGLEVFPLISLSIFIVFFIALLIVMLTMSKQKITELSHLPLKDSSNEKV